MGQLRTVSLSERDDQNKHKRGSRDDGCKHGGTEIVREHGVRGIFFADTDGNFDAGFIVRNVMTEGGTDIVGTAVHGIFRGNEVFVSVIPVFVECRNFAGYRLPIAEITENGKKIVNQAAEQYGKGDRQRKISICAVTDTEKDGNHTCLPVLVFNIIP